MWVTHLSSPFFCLLFACVKYYRESKNHCFIVERVIDTSFVFFDDSFDAFDSKAVDIFVGFRGFQLTT